MNTKNESTSKPVSKPKGSGSRQQVRESEMPEPVSANDDYPRERMIAEAAYFRAKQRDFTPGEELGDWLGAEADLNERHGY